MKHQGVTLKLGDRELEIPPLSIGQLKRLAKEVSALQELKPGTAINVDMMDMFLNVVHAALSRNYDDVPREWLEDAVDLGNMVDVINAVMNVSGFERRFNEQGKPPSQLTGTGSTPTLSPEQVGPGNT